MKYAMTIGCIGVLLAGRHGPLSSTFLRLSAGRGITEPSLIQNFSRESYAVGNPDLTPETVPIPRNF